MNCDEIKTELRNEIVKYVGINDKLPMRCLHQIEIIQCYVISKSKWLLEITKFVTFIVDLGIV